MIQRLLIPALWLLWFAYWMFEARKGKAIRRRESIASRIAHITPLAIAVFLLWWPRLSLGFLNDRFVPDGVATYIVGLLVVVLGHAFSVWARVHLGLNWSGTVTIKDDHELIRSGPYGIARHPIYTGLLLGFLGSAIARGEWRGLLAVAFVFYAFLRKIRLEERWMIELFGDRYRRYREEVSALVPGVF